MPQYDPAVVQKHADRLYSQATSAIFIWTVAGIIVGLVVGLLLSVPLSAFLPGRSSAPSLLPALICTVVAGVIGFAIGQARAFELKLKAQTALCQMKIEENTRRILSFAPEHASRTSQQSGS